MVKTVFDLNFSFRSKTQLLSFSFSRYHIEYDHDRQTMDTIGCSLIQCYNGLRAQKTVCQWVLSGQFISYRLLNTPLRT